MTVSVNQEYTWTNAGFVTAVDGWVQGAGNNYGLILGSTVGGGDDYIFAAREHANTAIRPRLVITYN